jgi:hypothetical protein
VWLADRTRADRFAAGEADLDHVHGDRVLGRVRGLAGRSRDFRRTRAGQLPQPVEQRRRQRQPEARVLAPEFFHRRWGETADPKMLAPDVDAALASDARAPG